MGSNSGEISFYQLEIRSKTFFYYSNFKIQVGQALPPCIHYRFPCLSVLLQRPDRLRFLLCSNVTDAIVFAQIGSCKLFFVLLYVDANTWPYKRYLPALNLYRTKSSDFCESGHRRRQRYSDVQRRQGPGRSLPGQPYPQKRSNWRECVSPSLVLWKCFITLQRCKERNALLRSTLAVLDVVANKYFQWSIAFVGCRAV